jgi:hypothetical protein
MMVGMTGEDYEGKNAKALERLPALLGSDEKVEALADCTRDGKYRGALTVDTPGLLALTDRRLLFLPRHEEGAQTIAHNEVAEATAHVGWVGGKLTITTDAGERAVYGLLEPKETARTMANYIVRLRGG